MEGMKPTIGRIVYFNRGTKEKPELLASIISFVWSDTCVNLMVINPNGNPFPMTSVINGEDSNQWDWMTYQKQKAVEENHQS